MQTESTLDRDLEPLTDGDRRLLEMARIHRSDAALGAQLGLPTGEVQRRLDQLALRLGYSGRMALRDGREPSLPAADGDVIDFTAEPQVRFEESDSVLPGFLFAVTSLAVAAGLVAWLVTR